MPQGKSKLFKKLKLFHLKKKNDMVMNPVTFAVLTASHLVQFRNWHQYALECNECNLSVLMEKKIKVCHCFILENS